MDQSSQGRVHSGDNRTRFVEGPYCNSTELSSGPFGAAEDFYVKP